MGSLAKLQWNCALARNWYASHSRYGSKTLHPQTSSTMHADYQYTQKKERVLTLWGSLPTTEGERLSDAETDRRKWEAVTATGAIRDSAGDGATGSEWECESERELDFSWEGETRSEREWCNVWSLNLVFLVCWFFCVPEVSPAMVDTYGGVV